MSTQSALIVGAGPTGMTTAVELARAGWDVRIIDKSHHAALYSQALVVQARTLEQFQRYGIAGEAVARGRPLRTAKIHSNGKSIVSLEFSRIASRYGFVLFLPQSETESILNERMEAAGVNTERGTELVSFADETVGTLAVLRHANGRTEEIRPRWIIGCDGAHSTVRTGAGIPFEGGGVGVSFFLGDLELDGPDAPGDDLVLNAHHGDVLFMGRLTETLTRVIVASAADQESGVDRDITVRDFQTAIDRAGFRIAVKSGAWMTPFHVDDRQAKHYRRGNAFLAGDASHIHSPVGGQGMNTGIQDAANLAWKLAAVARGADERLLDSYEEERAAVGRALLTFTERGLKLATASGVLVEGVRNTLAPFLTSLRPVQNLMLGFLSETAIDYRSSSIVADYGGDGSLRAGDRIPDVGVNDDRDAPTLLEDWTDGRHLAIVIDGSADDTSGFTARLPNARVIPIASSTLPPEARELFGVEKKVVIVRPDGYVGFRGPLDDDAELAAYVKQDALA